MREENAEYYLRRFVAEVQAAGVANCPEAARAHREMATQYLMRVRPPPVVCERPELKA